jgi:hypothetical protein
MGPIETLKKVFEYKIAYVHLLITVIACAAAFVVAKYVTEKGIIMILQIACYLVAYTQVRAIGAIVAKVQNEN